MVTPSRAAYLDLEQEVALLTPLHKIRRGEGPAVLSILLALVVDGVCVLLGTAIGGGSQAPIADRAAGWIRQAKDGGAMVREAMDRPGLPPEPGAAEMDALEDALHIVVLRIAGRGSDFLTTFYQSIHAETGALDFPTLQAHTNPTYRIAARMLVDRLRRPRLGWVEVRDGWWCVPPEHYARLTFWLGDHIRQAVDAEAEEEHDTEERTLRLVLPAMAS